MSRHKIMLMKLRTIIKGGRVHEVGYRFFLFTKAMELGCDRFFAKNESDGGVQFVVAIIEGDELQLADFKMFAKSHHPEGSEVADIDFEDYSGPIMSADAFLHFFAADQLNKGIPALLRIDRKQDKMLEKQDKMLEKQDKMLEKQDKMLEKQDKMLEKQDKMLETQDKMLEKQDITIAKLEETRSDIVREIKTSREEVIAKLDENREAIIGEIGEQKEILDVRLRRIESDISKLKAKVGI
jgi:acylphosphatase